MHDAGRSLHVTGLVFVVGSADASEGATAPSLTSPTASLPQPKLDVQRCRIWDLDETLIVFQTMLKMKESNVPRFAEVQLMKANPRRRMVCQCGPCPISNKLHHIGNRMEAVIV